VKKFGVRFNCITLREGTDEMELPHEAETCSENNGKFWDSFARFGVVMAATMEFTLF
jgi:hypothetical protein